MITIEKLSLLNMDIFRTLYDKIEDSYLCDKNFFEIYDNESFIIKYIIRKQIKLLKVNEQYIGYIWHEYPANNNLNRIYAFNLYDDYIDEIDDEFKNTINKNNYLFDINLNDKHNALMKKLNFNLNNVTILMKLKLNDINAKPIKSPSHIYFKNFESDKDELLRCITQNDVFKNKNRVSLTIEDIIDEENESYYLKDYCVFMKDYNENTIGYGQVILYKGEYTIVNFGIREEYRGNGYGEMLLRYILNLCYSTSIDEVYIKVEKENYKAFSLYQKAGFKTFIEYGSFINYYVD